MNRGKIPAENGVTLRHAGCRGLQFGIAISMLFLTAGQANSQPGDELAADAQSRPAANRQTAGPFDGLAGEYRGTHKGDPFVIWVDASAAVEAGQQAALLLFREQERPRLETYIKRIIDNPADYYRHVCERAGSDEQKGRLNDLYKVWNTQGGLALLQDFQGVRLPPGWEEIESQEYPPYLRTEEYIVLREREYMIRRIRRSNRIGALESVQLTQTGFIQNFFDNPVISVMRVDNASPSFKLLGSYLDAKFAAWQKLDALLVALHEPGRDVATVRPDLQEVCKLLMSNDSIFHPE